MVVFELTFVGAEVLLFDPDWEVAKLVRLQINRERTPAVNRIVLSWTRERASRVFVELFIGCTP
jgi:hypothetical protein